VIWVCCNMFTHLILVVFKRKFSFSCLTCSRDINDVAIEISMFYAASLKYFPNVCELTSLSRIFLAAILKATSYLKALYRVSLLSSFQTQIQTVKLSASNIHKASLCLTNSPNSPQAICMARISIASLSSLLGPNQTIHRFRIVKLELSTITPSVFVFTFSNRSRCSNRNNKAMGRLGGLSHSVTEASRSPVRALKRGRRCRGQGIIRKSCGAE